MITLRHVAHAVGVGGTDAPAYRVELLVGQHRLLGDEPSTEGGGDVGPSPFGFLLSGLAACTATTLRMYATRKGWDFGHITVDVRYDVDESGNASIERKISVPQSLFRRTARQAGRGCRANPGDLGHPHAHRHRGPACGVGLGRTGIAAVAEDAADGSAVTA
jgi:putative redox protein